MELSNNSINKAGDRLRHNPRDDEALNTVAAWRNKHIYALGTAFNLLKRHSDNIGNNAIYGQRLKRISSLVLKLKRLPKTQLSRMQDIGGCRVILSSYDKLRLLYNALKKSRTILAEGKDYITYPKDDGYRSIHLIYKLASKNNEHNGLKIELQLRTKLQHAWATAVEIIDSFEGESIKLGQGSEKWQRFFYLVADEFATLEQLPVHNNIKDRISEIDQLSSELGVIHKLAGYTAAFKIIKDNQDSKPVKHANFFVLSLLTNQLQIEITPFKKQFEAQEFYIEQEKEFISDSSVNILMLKMDSLKKIEKSYPNYFANSKEFLAKLKIVLQKQNTHSV